jgi:hypothetical protein
MKCSIEQILHKSHHKEPTIDIEILMKKTSPTNLC